MRYFYLLCLILVGTMQAVSSFCEVSSNDILSFSRCRKTAEAINNRMILIEQKVSDLQNCECTLDMALSMQEVADNLESLQKDMGGVEEFESVMDKMRLLDQDLAEMDMKIEEMTDDVDYDEYMKELDELEEKEAKERLAKMPEAPKTIRLVKEVEMKEKERVAELEYIVCSRRAKRNEMDN